MATRKLDRTIPGGFAGIRQTVVTIAALICTGSRSPRVIRFALSLIPPQPNAIDRLDVIRKVFYWVRNNVAYVKDPPNLELVQTAGAILRTRKGDCDDQSVLVGAVLRSLGLSVRIRIVSTSAARQFHHVFVEALDRGRWLPLDTTIKTSHPGEIHGKVKRSMVFNIPRGC